MKKGFTLTREATPLGCHVCFYPLRAGNARFMRSPESIRLCGERRQTGLLHVQQAAGALHVQHPPVSPQRRAEAACRAPEGHTPGAFTSSPSLEPAFAQLHEQVLEIRRRHARNT
jgi:hypothetical protein